MRPKTRTAQGSAGFLFVPVCTIGLAESMCTRFVTIQYRSSRPEESSCLVELRGIAVLGQIEQAEYGRIRMSLRCPYSSRTIFMPTN